MRRRSPTFQARYDSLKFALPHGVIHGDANVGNVLLDRLKNPVLIDLDGFCHGPREWNLVQTALFFDRFGWHAKEEYSEFRQTYGFDIMTWPGYETLADLHELRMVVWLSLNATKDSRSNQEPEKAARFAADWREPHNMESPLICDHSAGVRPCARGICAGSG
ncbi:phosphotransferase family protein [Actinopolymorpha pittospori]|uniref:phosphotransferase family protein n=1 Tax=Actinopolymorpha pittospori TaxID=648752 RepID=UPI00192E2B55